jgi:Thioredoxin
MRRFTRPSRTIISATLPLAALMACTRAPESAAADVPATDVRQIPEERKSRAPDVMMLAADRGRVIGSDSAPVRLLVVSDFQCDSCRQWFDQVLPVVRSDYVETGKVRLTWAHYPLRTHPNAVRAASAALCASAQGRFWEAGARLFAAQQLWGTSPRAATVIDSLAQVPGVEAYKLRNCIDSNRMLRRIRGDIDWADTVRAGRPLTVVVGARQIPGSAPIATVRAILDSAVAGR